MQKTLRKIWTRIRIGRGYCRYCQNRRTNHPELCAAHLIIFQRTITKKTVVPAFQPGRGRPDRQKLHDVVDALDRGEPSSQVREMVAQYLVATERKG